jgi:hypothetical protein
MTYTVKLFFCDRAFGGREEGGWWFDYGLPADDSEVGFTVSRRFKSKAKAQGYRARIQARLDRLNSSRPDLSSVASEGQYHALLCTTKPRPYPEARPYYD